MRLIKIEVDKILNRKFSRWLLIATTILFPIALVSISKIRIREDEITQTEFVSNLSFAIISYIQSYIFLPIWIIIFTGQELSNGYVNRFVFASSRKDYFLAKITYCTIVSLYFSVLGIISFILSIYTSSFTSLDIGILQYVKLLLQFAFSFFSYAVLLTGLVFIIRSPAIGFIIYLAWNFTEGILYRVAEGIWSIELSWLPLHLIRTLFTYNGETASGNYYNPLDGNLTVVALPLAFMTITMLLSYHFFKQTNLNALTD